MIKQFIFSFIILMAFSAFGQKNNLSKSPPHIPTQKEMEADARNHNCIKRINRSFTARLKNYPFNISTQVQFVSFFESSHKIGDEIAYVNFRLPMLNDTICYSKLHEIKTLTFSQVDKLTDIIYNYGYTGDTFTISEASCYTPRNAILFIDSSGKAFEFIEICFDCSKTRVSSDKISLGDPCDQKMGMLFDLFKKAGIEYSINETVVTDQ